MLAPPFSRLRKLALLCSILALIAYALLVIVSPGKLGYDEWFYLETAKDLPRLGLSHRFVRDLPGPTGILHSLVHLAAAPITVYRLPGVRWVNPALLVASFALLLAILRAGRTAAATLVLPPLALAALWLAAPTTGTITCLVLTELASIVLALVSTLLLVLADQTSGRSHAATAALLAAAGVALGLATLGRQNLIVLLPAALPFFLPLRGRRITDALLFGLPAVLLFAWPITVWQGLVPPGWPDAGPGIRPSYFLVSLAYLGLIALLLLPGLVGLSRRRVAAALLLATPLSLATPDLQLVPSRTLISGLLGPTAIAVLGHVVGIAMVAVALLTLLALLERLRAAISASNPLVAYAATAALLICLSNIKIVHQFSSRYITLALPFVILVAAFQLPVPEPAPVAAGRLPLRGYAWRFAAGLTLSVLLVLNYYRVIGW